MAGFLSGISSRLHGGGRQAWYPSGMHLRWFLPLILCAGPALYAGEAAAQTACPAPKAMRFEFDHKIYRNVLGFTDGLEVHKGDLYESTGTLGGGTRIIRLTKDGHASVLHDAGSKYFGEGLTFLGDRLYQLSWQDHLVFVYDENLKPLHTMKNPHDGWGMTNDGRYLIFGDGSSRLYYTDPDTFAVKGTITVKMGGTPVTNVNELEYVGGKIYANIWMTRQIIRLDAKSGCVETVAQMDNLWDHMTTTEKDYVESDGDFVLNGIAYDPDSKLFTLMGKEWPMAFAGHFVDQ